MERINKNTIMTLQVKPDELPIEIDYLNGNGKIKKYILKDNKGHTGIHLNIKEY